MRQYNLSVMKPPVSKSSNANAAGPSKVSATYATAAKSLDLIRQNIQRNITQDIQEVITKYMNVFVKPGIENIKNNLGPEAVTDEHINQMCRQILEEAKRNYPVINVNLASMVLDAQGLGGIVEPSNSNNDVDHQHHPHLQQPQPPSQFSAPPQLQQPPPPPMNSNAPPDVKLPLTSPSFGIKRESDTDSEASSMSSAGKKPKKSSKANNGSTPGGAGEGGSSKNSNANKDSTPSKPKKPSGPSRKHVALWDINRLTTDTMFIMGAKANKALGFAQTRGRLYVKHPGLFKYASDTDDKEWLSKNKLMPATGGRAYIMLLEDIEKLAKDNALNVTINYEDIKGFKVPDFILDKMKNYITTWKKTYAEEDEKNAAAQRNRNTNKQQQQLNSSTSININNNPQTTHANANANPNSMPGGLNVHPHPVGLPNHNNSMNNMSAPLPPPPPPPPQTSTSSALPPDIYQKPQQQQHPSHIGPQPQPPQLNNFNIVGGGGNSTTTILYDPSSFSTQPQPHEMTEFMHIDKPPPYPGQPQQQQQHPAMQSMNNPGNNYTLHSNQLDPIEQAISKGDWSQVSDRSLLQYALQSTRNIGSWDPQDSFDLIDSVTNGGLTVVGGGVVGGGSGSTGVLGESSLLQISPNNPGAHLTAPPLGPVSPNCELSAVLDQVTAFQYTET